MNHKVRKYTGRWFRTISDRQLHREREPIRRKAVYEGGPYFWLLKKFDDEIIKRMNQQYTKAHPESKPRHREHGWYL